MTDLVVPHTPDGEISMGSLVHKAEAVMKKTIVAVLIFAVTSLYASTALAALPDQYLGDASIYGSSGALQRNILIIIDDSGSMQDSVPGDSYDPAKIYTAVKACGSNGTVACSATAVYKNDHTQLNSDVNTITTSCNGANPRNLLLTTGHYSGRTLSTSGNCGSRGTAQYFTGNYINYLGSPSSGTRPKIDIAKSVVKDLITTTSGIKFGLMTFHYVGNKGQGGEFLSTNVSGASTKYITTVKKMDDIFSGTITNRTALLAAVDTLNPQGITPLGEALYEAMRYYSGGASAFGNTVGITSGKYTSPVEASCQKNYIIFVTDGMANADDDAVLKTLCKSGDCDNDGVEPGDLNHVLDDVAKALNLSPQQVVTYTIGFGLTGADADAVALLNKTADGSHGKGQSFLASSEQELQSAFSAVLNNMLSVDTAFAAPVAPVSPENRTYGGSRVYMGFFKPDNIAFWNGNLKKYGISTDNSPTILDMNGNFATYVDLDGDGTDDNTLTALPPDSLNGSFRETAQSYWSPNADSTQVDKGGVGRQLQLRTANTRKIYTYTGTNNVLTDASNKFSTSNATITTTKLGVADSASRDSLINFIYGQDAYDENNNGNLTENRAWIMGDVLHSNPRVVNYASYAFTPTNESNCTLNKSIIYVGSNDGMLHAFNDCDGSELWGFIPPDMLGNLKYLKDENHTYFVDSSPITYIYDANDNGTIDSGDKVILLFGTRRGGGVASGTATGSYYALDISDPSSPQFLWRISNTTPTTGSWPATPVFAELAESWSEPKIVRMKIGTSDKIVAVVGAGYDNLNEDGRFGATQTFTGTGLASIATTGEGAVTSTGTASPLNPKGRGVYFIEVATLGSSGIPSFTNSGSKIMGYTYGVSVTSSSNAITDPNLTFSFPSEITAIDATNTGYTTRLYAADTGGNIWRFDVGDSTPSKWTARKLFSSNPGSGGSSDKGRKMFYKPSVVSEYGYKMVFFGTGDREHPLNTAVVDRMYGIVDRDQTFTLTESNLMDVTTDQLQTTTVASGTGSVADILSKLYPITNTFTANYGWYIKLDQNSGEKALSVPLVFNKVAYFTTHAPSTTVSSDPCLAKDDLGTARMYAVNYKTGEAVMNFDTTNDSTTVYSPRAKSGSILLLRSDRVITLGSGISSGVGVVITPGGEVKLMTGADKKIVTRNPPPGGGINLLYWGQK